MAADPLLSRLYCIPHDQPPAEGLEEGGGGGGGGEGRGRGGGREGEGGGGRGREGEGGRGGGGGGGGGIMLPEIHMHASAVPKNPLRVSCTPHPEQ